MENHLNDESRLILEDLIHQMEVLRRELERIPDSDMLQSKAGLVLAHAKYLLETTGHSKP